MTNQQHFLRSSFREKLIEHLFIGELLKLAWKNHEVLEIIRPEVDAYGYDLVAELDDVIRHIQIKSSFRGARTARQNIQSHLMRKPSACVVWVFFDPNTLDLGPFRFFGAAPGEKMPDIRDFPLAKHTKADATGTKGVRPALRQVPKGAFKEIQTIEELYFQLFGRLT